MKFRKMYIFLYAFLAMLSLAKTVFIQDIKFLLKDCF